MRARKYRVASNDTALSATRYGTHVRLSRIISCRYTVVIADFTLSPYSNAGSEGVHPRLDWLLSSSQYETNADVLGQMDAAQVPNVHLEAVEEAQNKGGQLEKAGRPG